VTVNELEKLKMQNKMSQIKEEKMKEKQLHDRISSLRKKQEEEIAKYIGNIGRSTYQVPCYHYSNNCTDF